MGDQNQGHEANATGSSTANGSLGGPEDLSEYPPHSIAVVGMAGRFPDADTVDELWEILLDARSTLRRADVERLQLPKDESHADTAWWGNWIRDPDAFDHVFFKKSSREAVAWDPQQRVLLQVVYEALESTGHFSPSSVPEADDDYGCYIGAVMNSYYDNLSCHPPTTYATLGTGRCFLSGCMSHYFGFTGPSMTIDTACSSSLVAIDAACRAIWSGGCSRAIAGGTNVISSPGDYRNLHTTGFLSPSGQCKPFDRGADGYCRGEGVGVVVLKRLADAVREHDNVLGVIVGSAVNQNGNASHITVPQSGSQMDLYHKVMKLANVTPGEVTYVEAHGTGTGVGDPVEVRGIRDAYGGPTRDSLLHFGSIKVSLFFWFLSTRLRAIYCGLDRVSYLIHQPGKHWPHRIRRRCFGPDQSAAHDEAWNDTQTGELPRAESYHTPSGAGPNGHTDERRALESADSSCLRQQPRCRW